MNYMLVIEKNVHKHKRDISENYLPMKEEKRQQKRIFLF